MILEHQSCYNGAMIPSAPPAALLAAAALFFLATSCDDPGHLVSRQDGAADRGVKLLDGQLAGDTVRPPDKPKPQIGRAHV